MSLIIRHQPLSDYRQTWQSMSDFVDLADASTAEEIWLLQHPPVYTVGRSGDKRHWLRNNGIPMVECDRGGQITYHGPGQIIAYVLLNIHRRRLGLRELVRRLEAAVISLLATYNIVAAGNIAAPGVYVGAAKIAALGLRVRRGWTYHGLSLNVDMALHPFDDINPCGYANLPITQMIDLGVSQPLAVIADELSHHLIDSLNR